MLTKKWMFPAESFGRGTLAAMVAVCVAASSQLAVAAPKDSDGAGEKAPRSAKSEGGERREAKSSERSSANDPEAVELLRAIEQRHGAAQTVAGRFLQTRRVAGSPDDIKSVAQFQLQKPNKFRADYLKPGQAPATDGYPYMTTNLISGRHSYQYVKELDQVSHYQFANEKNVRDFNYLLLGFGAHTEELLKVYRVKSVSKAPRGYRGVQLVPLDPADAGFKSITMLVTADESLLPAQFSMRQTDDSQVTVDLETQTLQVGGRVDERLFKPNFPKDAETVELN